MATAPVIHLADRQRSTPRVERQRSVAAYYDKVARRAADAAQLAAERAAAERRKLELLEQGAG